jgi:hypothetical protein
MIEMHLKYVNLFQKIEMVLKCCWFINMFSQITYFHNWAIWGGGGRS